MEKLDVRDFLKRYGHIIILFVIFAAALWLRSFPARFGELQALDPFYFYRMNVELMQNGWQFGLDSMRYFPTGVDTLATEYIFPLALPAVVYTLLSIIGINMHFLQFAIMWPAVLGAIAIIPMYFLGKELFSSRNVGLFAAFFLATIPAFITRTSAGFFEKEPLAGVFIIASAYFFVRAFRRSSWLSGIMAGVFLAFMSLSWGGTQYIYLLYGGLMFLVFVASSLVVVLDYMFSGFGRFAGELNRYMSIDMIKAYLPLILIGTLVQQPFGRKIAIDQISIVIAFLGLGILLLRFGIERFSIVKKEYLPYAAPAILILLLAGSLVGAMFDDSIASRFSSITGYISFGKSTVESTVAENAPGDWNNIVSTTGAGFASAVVPQLGYVAPYMAAWGFMFLGIALALYRFWRTSDFMMFFPVVWMVSGIFGVFYYVRLIFLLGPVAALMSGFFVAWVVERSMRLKVMEKVRAGKTLRERVNVFSLLLVAFVTLVIAVNFASAYAYSLNLGPSICFPRYNSNNPFDVQPCVTIDGNGNEVLADNQPWYEAFTFLANETPENSSILSWWDFGYWFQARGERPSIADGGNLGGVYAATDHEIAKWFTDDVANWDEYVGWLRDSRKADYILMDYTLPGKYGAISKIASDGEQIVGFLQFSQKGIEPQGNDSIYIFSNGPYEIWLPLNQQGNLAGTPMFLVLQNGQYYQKSYINDVCTKSGIISAAGESPSIPGCVSISDMGIYYVPPEAENSIFTSLMFMEGTGLPVEKVFDNQLIKIYRILYD